MPPTKAERHRRAQVLIDSHGFDMAWPITAVAELAELTATPSLRAVIRKRNPANPKDMRHLHVLAYDWQLCRQWSWVKAIRFDGVENADEKRIRHNEMLALRAAIKPDMEDFFASQYPPQCANPDCGSGVVLTVDHVHPPFISIAEDFREKYSPLALKPTNGDSDILADDAVLAEWITFHARHAVYQILCRSCNSRKGHRYRPAATV